MIGELSLLAGLLAECDAHGVQLLPVGDGGLTIDGPQEAMTPDLLDRLKAHKADVLAALRSVPDVAPSPPVAEQEAAATPTRPVCRCGSTTWQDVPIHYGQSVRRDCGRCGRFLEFPMWYGKGAGHKGQ